MGGKGSKISVTTMRGDGTFVQVGTVDYNQKTKQVRDVESSKSGLSLVDQYNKKMISAIATTYINFYEKEHADRVTPMRVRVEGEGEEFIEGYILSSWRFRDCIVIFTYQRSDRGSRIVPYFLRHRSVEKGVVQEGKCSEIKKQWLIMQYREAVERYAMQTDGANNPELVEMLRNPGQFGV